MVSNSPGLYNIRQCRRDAPEDHRAIEHLERVCAQGVGVKFYFATEADGKPRAFKFENYFILLAEHVESGQIVGTISANVRRVRFGEGSERFENVSYICSLRVHPDHRRYGLASRLVSEVERILREEKQVSFVYLGLSEDNEPSRRLFEEKHGYRHLFTGLWPELNVKHRASISPVDDSREGVSKLDEDESRNFLKQHCAKAFLFPCENLEAAIKGNVFIAKSGDDFVALNLHKCRCLLGFEAVPFWNRAKRFVSSFVNYFLPNYIEPSYDLGRPVSFVGAHPFVISTRNAETTKQLFSLVLNAILKDLAASGYGDMLFVPITKHSNLDKVGTEHVEAIKQCLGGGSMGVDHCYAKSLKSDPKEAAEIMQLARDSTFWFMDGREF